MRKNKKTNLTVRQKKRQKSIFSRIMTVLIVMVISVTGIAVGAYIYLDTLVGTSVSGVLPSEIGTAPELRNDVVNILVAGIDYEEGRGDDPTSGLTDLIMYVNFDIKAQKISIFQIPRDTYIGDAYDTGSGAGALKINALYSNADDPNDRIGALAQCIYDQFKLPIDYYATINMESFKGIVDAIGGVEVYVPRDIYQQDETGQTMAEPTFNAGEYVVLNGALAEVFVRSREYALADIDRLLVQRYFYAGMFKKFTTMPVSDIIKLMPYYVSFVNTDMDLATLGSLAVGAMNVPAENIVVATLPGEGFEEYFEIVGQNSSFFSGHISPTYQILNDYFRPYSEPIPAEELGIIEYRKTVELDGSVESMGGIINEEGATQ